jgi:hypothetical protein
MKSNDLKKLPAGILSPVCLPFHHSGKTLIWNYLPMHQISFFAWVACSSDYFNTVKDIEKVCNINSIENQFSLSI